MNLTKFKSRVISVTPATNDTAKRQATTIINPAPSRSSYSPTPDPSHTNDLEMTSAGSPSSQPATIQAKPPPDDRRSRTIALINIPDTVVRNSASLSTNFAVVLHFLCLREYSLAQCLLASQYTDSKFINRPPTASVSSPNHMVPS